jgi:peptide/nickel transport system permease protein
MSATLPANSSLADARQRSEGVWHAAWRRLRADRLGLVALVVVLAFFVLILLAALGLVAKNWQDEVGVSSAPPTFLGPAPPEATGSIEAPKGPNVDLSDIDPLAPWVATDLAATCFPRRSRAPRSRSSSVCLPRS